MDLFTKMTNAICKRGAILSVQERVLRHFGRREEARVILRALSSHHDMASEILTPKSGCPNMGLKVGSAAERWNDEVFPLVLRGVVDPEIPGFDAPTTAQYKIDQYIQKRMDGMEPHPPCPHENVHPYICPIISGGNYVKCDLCDALMPQN